MSEWMQKNLKYPRLTFLLVGMFMGLIIAGFTGSVYSEKIERIESIRKEQLAEKEKRIQTLETRYTRMQAEYKKMKSQVDITEVKNADGSSKKTFQSRRSVESAKIVAEQKLTLQRLEYERRAQLMRHQQELQEVRQSRPTANFSLGIDYNSTRFVHASYEVYRPITFGLFGDERGRYGFSLGVSW